MSNITIGSMLIVVAAALLDDDGRVLVQQRPVGTALAGLWEFPGGKIDPGETPEGALVRELSEELGILVVPANLLPIGFARTPLGDRHLLLLLYGCRRWSGVVQALHAEVLRWVTPDELRTLAMPPADAPLVEALRNWM